MQLLLAYDPSDPSSEGNCKSGKYPFKKDRILITDPAHADDNTVYDPSLYDFTMDYGYGYEFNEDDSITIKLKKNLTNIAESGNAKGMGSRLSTTRFIKNGRISAVYESVNRFSVVTTFITMSKDFDEIDVEVTPQNHKLNMFTANVFAKGTPENLHNPKNNAFGYALAVDTGAEVEKPHLYTIDWNRDRIVWEFEGQHKRTYKRGQPALHGTPEFPDNPKLWYPVCAKNKKKGEKKPKDYFFYKNY